MKVIALKTWENLFNPTNSLIFILAHPEFVIFGCATNALRNNFGIGIDKTSWVRKEQKDHRFPKAETARLFLRNDSFVLAPLKNVVAFHSQPYALDVCIWSTPKLEFRGAKFTCCRVERNMHSLGYFHRGKRSETTPAKLNTVCYWISKGQELIFYFWNTIATTSSSIWRAKTCVVNVFLISVNFKLLEVKEKQNCFYWNLSINF